jgi:hypothetical protein
MLVLLSFFLLRFYWGFGLIFLFFVEMLLDEFIYRFFFVIKCVLVIFILYGFAINFRGSGCWLDNWSFLWLNWGLFWQGISLGVEWSWRHFPLDQIKVVYNIIKIFLYLKVRFWGLLPCGNSSFILSDDIIYFIRVFKVEAIVLFIGNFCIFVDWRQ